MTFRCFVADIDSRQSTRVAAEKDHRARARALPALARGDVWVTSYMFDGSEMSTTRSAAVEMPDFSVVIKARLPSTKTSLTSPPSGGMNGRSLAFVVILDHSISSARPTSQICE